MQFVSTSPSLDYPKLSPELAKKVELSRQALIKAPGNDFLHERLNWANALPVFYATGQKGEKLLGVFVPLRERGLNNREQEGIILGEPDDIKKLTGGGAEGVTPKLGKQLIIVPFFDPKSEIKIFGLNFRPTQPGDREKIFESVVRHEACHADPINPLTEVPCYQIQNQYLYANKIIPRVPTTNEILANIIEKRDLTKYAWEVMMVFGNDPKVLASYLPGPKGTKFKAILNSRIEKQKIMIDDELRSKGEYNPEKSTKAKQLVEEILKETGDPNSPKVKQQILSGFRAILTIAFDLPNNPAGRISGESLAGFINRKIDEARSAGVPLPAK